MLWKVSKYFYSVINCRFKFFFLKQMTFIYSNSFEFLLQICLISWWWFFKKPNVTDDFINLGLLSITLKIFVLNIILLLCTLKSLTSLINFSLSLNILKTFPWWYALDVIFFFFNSSVSIISLLIMESISCFWISSLLSLLLFVVFSEPFCSCKQTKNHYNTSFTNKKCYV